MRIQIFGLYLHIINNINFGFSFLYFLLWICVLSFLFTQLFIPLVLVSTLQINSFVLCMCSFYMKEQQDAKVTSSISYSFTAAFFALVCFCKAGNKSERRVGGFHLLSFFLLYYICYTLTLYLNPKSFGHFPHFVMDLQDPKNGSWKV